MKRALTIVGVFVLALAATTAVVAQSSPFDGTWKLNPAKSKYTTGAPPKEQTAKITTIGDQVQTEVTGTNADGTPIQMKYVTPLKGGVGKVLSGGPYDGVTRKDINSTTRDVSYMQGGKEALHITAVVSKDGKTLTITGKGTDAQGHSVSSVTVLDRQ
jgi:hypothetical protein